MDPDVIEHRLAAILSVDAVGYSRLMAMDGVATVHALNACRDVIRQHVARHGGRIVDSPGDNVLAEVPSAIAATCCALEIQESLAERNATLPSERRMEFRIGVHLGDIMVDGEHIYGDGVNVAARIQTLAHPGSVCVSGVVYDQVRSKLDVGYQDLGLKYLKNLPEPLRVFRVQRAKDLATEYSPALPVDTGAADNLPSPASAFVGRQTELADVMGLLEDRYAQLVTLVGPGGIGKTRLALEAASQRLGRHQHGIHFIALAPLGSADFLVSTVAAGLKFSFPEEGDEKAQLLGYLRGRDVMLLMDNFEHVLEGAPLVGQILDAAPRVRVLATSRERLGIPPEKVFELQGLSVPADETAPEFKKAEAVQLFVTYARRAEAHYELRELDKGSVARICQMVSGNPLAIELAAMWTRMLSAAEIVEQLAADLDFLETTMRGVPERHRSMRAVFNYSWNSLREREQDVFRKLSVFRGGFSSEAAKEVARATVRDLAALVDKSLITRDRSGRFSIHELLRQFASERLGAVAQTAGAAHCAYYARLLRRRGPELSRKTQLEAARQIEDAIDNLRAAWEWALATRNYRIVADMAVDLGEFFSLRCRRVEGEETLRRATEEIETQPGSDREAALCRVLSRRALFASDPAQARPLAERGLAIARAIDDPAEIAFGLRALGATLNNLGLGEQAREAVEQSLELCRELGDRSGQTRALRTLGFIHGRLGERNEALRRTEQSLEIARELGDDYRVAVALQNLGSWNFAAGNIDVAAQQMGEALAVWRKIGNPAGVAYALAGYCGIAYYWKGRLDEAAMMIDEAVRLTRDIGHAGGTGLSMAVLARLRIYREQYSEGRDLAREALESGVTTGSYMAVMFANEALGSALLGLGQREEAKPCLWRALTMASQMKILPVAASVLFWIGVARARDGDLEAAAELISAAASDPLAPAWFADRMPLVLETSATLRAQLPAETLGAAQARGRERGSATLAAEILKRK